VYIEEVQDEPVSHDPTSDANVAEQVETSVARETPPQPWRSARLREACREVLLLGYGEVLLLDNDEPATYAEAMMDPYYEKWQVDMRSEIDSMGENQVWNLVDPPEGVRPIECKWIYKKKKDMDGNVNIYKARLVAKGFRQVQGVDYDKTFLPVVILKSIRIILAIATYFDYEIWQMDVKTTFLNGNLDEDVYMIQLEGFVDPINAEKICELQKSIYGLKQASQSWNIRFDEVVKGFGFHQNEEEACVYKKESGSAIVFLIFYVDDILLIGNDIPMLESIKASLKKSFSMKDLGEAAYILGIRIYRDRSIKSRYVHWQGVETVQHGTVQERVLTCVTWYTISIIHCPRRGMKQLHILRGMKAEVITSSVAMCIHGWNVEPVMVVWILWIFTLCFILELSNWYLVYFLEFNIQEGSCELCGG
jgi:hypothetical protein